MALEIESKTLPRNKSYKIKIFQNGKCIIPGIYYDYLNSEITIMIECVRKLFQYICGNDIEIVNSYVILDNLYYRSPL